MEAGDTFLVSAFFLFFFNVDGKGHIKGKGWGKNKIMEFKFSNPTVWNLPFR